MNIVNIMKIVKTVKMSNYNSTFKSKYFVLSQYKISIKSFEFHEALFQFNRLTLFFIFMIKKMPIKVI